MEAKPIIAIVDDDESVRESLSSLIKSVGLVAISFGSAEEYLGSGHLRDTACVVLDIRMPGMNGLELQRHLRAAEVGVPIVFISAHADRKTRAEALAGGALDLLTKPFNAEELLKALRIALDRSGIKNRDL
jgi:FixJ family two-component response regulator